MKHNISQIKQVYGREIQLPTTAWSISIHIFSVFIPNHCTSDWAFQWNLQSWTLLLFCRHNYFIFDFTYAVDYLSSLPFLPKTTISPACGVHRKYWRAVRVSNSDDFRHHCRCTTSRSHDLLICVPVWPCLYYRFWGYVLRKFLPWGFGQHGVYYHITMNFPDASFQKKKKNYSYSKGGFSDPVWMACMLQ